MEQIIAYGDSNTWGLNPVLKNRYPDNVRWTGILRSRLGSVGMTLAEEGLCGRTTVFRDPRREGLAGAESIPQVLARNPQASAARAASRAFTGRAAFPRAPSSIHPATAAPAMSHLSSSGTKDVTASRTRAASAPKAKPAPAPCSRRCMRRRRFAGASAFRSSFIVSGPFSAVYLRVFRRFQRSTAKDERGGNDQQKCQQGDRAAADQRHGLPAGLVHQAEIIQDPAGIPVFQP